MDQINDLEARDAYRMLTKACGCSHEEAMACMREICRDNARTPMQWDGAPLAGFTTGTPWLPVNPNCVQINAAAQVRDPHSVFAHYQGLIRLRHQSDLVVHGHFRLLEPASEELFVYERLLGNERMLVVCNFSDHEVQWRAPADYAEARRVDVACNYGEPGAAGVVRPYESFALEIKRGQQGSGQRDASQW